MATEFWTPAQVIHLNIDKTDYILSYLMKLFSKFEVKNVFIVFWQSTDID